MLISVPSSRLQSIIGGEKASGTWSSCSQCICSQERAMQSAQLTSSTGTQFRSHPQWKWVFPHYLTWSRYSPKGVPTRSSSSWASLKFVRLTVNTHSRPLGLHSPHPVHSEDLSDGWRSSGFSVIVHVRTPSAWLVLVSLMLHISV